MKYCEMVDYTFEHRPEWLSNSVGLSLIMIFENFRNRAGINRLYYYDMIIRS